MRLTLRTLLAYLDDTLDPEDVQALRDKLGESGFATQLVQRIRDTLSSNKLAAPSPNAVGPVEEANVISEYLDSTLPSEQVAEMERACLESAPHLAEAAACHQILTMVLGQKAEVSPELRQRIYDLPDTSVEEIAAAAGSFSSLAIPDQPELAPLQDDLPTADAGTPSSGEAVQPVGLADSGVSDAPTRLREAGVVDGRPANQSNPAIAGSKPPTSDEATKIYGGAIRTSRITPWLVSLGLAALLLFALSQIFSPLIDQYTVASGEGGGDAATTAQDDPQADVEVSSEDSPLMKEIDEPSANSDNDDDAGLPDQTGEGTEKLPPPRGDERTENSNTPAENSNTPADNSNTPAENSDTPADNVEPKESVTPGEPREPGEPGEAVSVEMPEKDVAAGEPGTAESAVAKPSESAETKLTPEENPAVKAAAVDPPPPAPDVNAAPLIELAKVTSENTLLAGLVGEKQWVRLKKDMPIGSGQTVICAPLFRGQMESSGKIKVTMVGSSQIAWVQGDDRVTLNFDYGRLLLSATEPNVSVDVVLGDLPVTLQLADVDTIVALSVMYFRAPGFDPQLDDNRRRLAGVLSVQGAVKLKSDGDEQQLLTGQQWIKRSDQDSAVTPVESVPGWIDAPDPSDATLEATARKGLLAILDENALELSLREATGFRRAEVAALAGRTLLIMGRPDIYFGGDGILGQFQQRSYWQDHYQALTSFVDRSAQNTKIVNLAVKNMDSANAKAIQRLLIGYSPNQLVEGGDEELVAFLDSPSMAVRILALENLRRITGTTLYFCAEENNAVRRKDGIKKWQARLRKSDIR